MTDGDYRGRFLNSLAFGLDRFQVEAIDAVDEHVNVLVSAPTGSGKTLIANYAIGRIFERGDAPSTPRRSRRSPTRSTTNSARSTASAASDCSPGTCRSTRSAEVVVMTTEVLRNMLLTESHQLNTLGLVVLDEVHYLQDPFRGGVWEEVIILTPAAVRFVALSATIGNADFIGEWFAEVRGPTAIIVENERPIQLHNHLAVDATRPVRRRDRRPARRPATLGRGPSHRQPHEGDAQVPARSEVEGTEVQRAAPAVSRAAAQRTAPRARTRRPLAGHRVHLLSRGL